MQRNTAWATLTLCALVAALAGRALASGLRAALAVALPAVFISKRQGRLSGHSLKGAGFSVQGLGCRI
jgi:hypothetical protein